MTTPQSVPLIVLEPVADDRNLLLKPAESADSCCGGGSCSI